MESCDVYFYNLGKLLGVDKIEDAQKLLADQFIEWKVPEQMRVGVSPMAGGVSSGGSQAGAAAAGDHWHLR